MKNAMLTRTEVLAKIKRAKEILQEVYHYAENLHGIMEPRPLSDVIDTLDIALETAEKVDRPTKALSRQEFANAVRTILGN